MLTNMYRGGNVGNGGRKAQESENSVAGRYDNSTMR